MNSDYRPFLKRRVSFTLALPSPTMPSHRYYGKCASQKPPNGSTDLTLLKLPGFNQIIFTFHTGTWWSLYGTGLSSRGRQRHHPTEDLHTDWGRLQLVGQLVRHDTSPRAGLRSLMPHVMTEP